MNNKLFTTHPARRVNRPSSCADYHLFWHFSLSPFKVPASLRRPLLPLYFYYRNWLLARNSISRLKLTIRPPSWAQDCPAAPRAAPYHEHLTDLTTLPALLLISAESALGATTTSTHANLCLDQENFYFYSRNELLAKKNTCNLGTPSGPLHQHTRVPYESHAAFSRLAQDSPLPFISNEPFHLSIRIALPEVPTWRLPAVISGLLWSITRPHTALPSTGGVTFLTLFGT